APGTRSAGLDLAPQYGVLRAVCAGDDGAGSSGGARAAAPRLERAGDTRAAPGALRLLRSRGGARVGVVVRTVSLAREARHGAARPDGGIGGGAAGISGDAVPRGARGDSLRVRRCRAGGWSGRVAAVLAHHLSAA